eukprot:scaffold33969_cov47-Phaeocystis_antarctica.AAC.1
MHGPGSGSASAAAASSASRAAAASAAAADFVVSSLTFMTIGLDGDRWADNRWLVATCVVRKAVADAGQSSKHAKDMGTSAIRLWWGSRRGVRTTTGRQTDRQTDNLVERHTASS